jgi:hypothetical protein
MTNTTVTREQMWTAFRRAKNVLLQAGISSVTWPTSKIRCDTYAASNPRILTLKAAYDAVVGRGSSWT